MCFGFMELHPGFQFLRYNLLQNLLSAAVSVYSSMRDKLKITLVDLSLVSVSFLKPP